LPTGKKNEKSIRISWLISVEHAAWQHAHSQYELVRMRFVSLGSTLCRHLSSKRKADIENHTEGAIGCELAKAHIDHAKHLAFLEGGRM
jgi:hypothetical protein